MSFSYEQGSKAMRLYRQILKFHIRKMPEDMRVLGDLYVKQEFRQHLDKASEEQMSKFLVAWEMYAKQISNLNNSSTYHLKKSLENKEFDNMFKEKISQDQFNTLNDFKDVIYETEQKKKSQ